MTELQLFQQWLDYCDISEAQVDRDELLSNPRKYFAHDETWGTRFEFGVMGNDFMSACFNEAGAFVCFERR
jgi:hypothetical protein